MKYIFMFALGITILTALFVWLLAPSGIVENEPVNGNHEDGIVIGGKFIPDSWLVCETDSDCFAGECCHSRFCVNIEGKPDCEGAFCTTDCRPDTLDCGCGGCSCVEGRCSIKVEDDPNCQVGG